MERNYTIPLRREAQRAPIYKRTKRAVNAIRSFIKKHMKVEEVKIGPKLNDTLWERGNKNPPPRIKVHTKKEENYAHVELENVPFPIKHEKKKEPKTLKEKVEAKLEEKQPKAVKKQQEEKAKEKELEEELVHEGKVKNKQTDKGLTPENALKDKQPDEHIMTESDKKFNHPSRR